MENHYEGMDITAEEALEECKPLDYAIRQYRHNYDNSESLFHPKEGFVFAYDIEITKKIVDDLEATIQSQSEQIAELCSLISDADLFIRKAANTHHDLKLNKAEKGALLRFYRTDIDALLAKHRAQSDN